MERDSEADFEDISLNDEVTIGVEDIVGELCEDAV